MEAHELAQVVGVVLPVVLERRALAAEKQQRRAHLLWWNARLRTTCTSHVCAQQQACHTLRRLEDHCRLNGRS